MHQYIKSCKIRILSKIYNLQTLKLFLEMKCLYFFFAPESDWIDLFCYFLSHLVLKHRGNWVEKGNDKDLFDTFIQKMAKKDLNDIGVISINLEMIYSSLPHYFTLYQILFFSNSIYDITLYTALILSKCGGFVAVIRYLLQ